MNAEPERRRMLEALIARGIRDPRVLAAMAEVPRHSFLPAELAERSYEDSPLPIGCEQTISQPYIVALMTEAMALQPTDRVLEIGTGSGYGAAVAAQLAAEVFTVERFPELAQKAREHLAALGLTNVHVVEGDGTLGWSEHAPYDAIVVTAGAPAVPGPLLDQLAEGGRLVIPLGGSGMQRLWRFARAGHGFTLHDLGTVRFVPLIGCEGWSEKSA
ncbi:MAG: protein-L-isoaspartate(D-aspartate) O-methyltransferase [Myxococcota bacterium]